VKAVDTGQSGFTVTTGTWWPGWTLSLLDIDGHGQYGVFLDNGEGLMTPLSTGVPGEPQTRPWLSGDRLRLYFGSSRATGTSRLELFVATRASTGVSFGAPAAIASLNLPTSSSAAISLTSDELTAVFESDRSGGAGGTDLWIATRTSRTGAFSTVQPLTVLSSAFRDGSPELAPDGRTIYFESDRPGGSGGTDVWTATRDSVGAVFSAPVDFSAINSAGTDSHPALSADTQELYFSSDRAGGAATGNMWRARVLCDAVTGSSTPVASGGGSLVVHVTDASGCAWAATSSQSWITFGSAPSGSGTGAVTLVVAVNSGAARTGAVTLGGQTNRRRAECGRRQHADAARASSIVAESGAAERRRRRWRRRLDRSDLVARAVACSGPDARDAARSVAEPGPGAERRSDGAEKSTRRGQRLHGGAHLGCAGVGRGGRELRDPGGIAPRRQRPGRGRYPRAGRSRSPPSASGRAPTWCAWCRGAAPA